MIAALNTKDFIELVGYREWPVVDGWYEKKNGVAVARVKIDRETYVGRNIAIRGRVELLAGCHIGMNCIFDGNMTDTISVGYCSTVGAETRIRYGVKVGKHAIVGSNCHIEEFANIGDRIHIDSMTRIGVRSRLENIQNF